jgi:DNA polymerase elongation subunit (family B)
LVTKAIDKIRTCEGIQQQDLVISKSLRHDIEEYRSLFAHVSAAIQLLSNNAGGKRPSKGDTIQYIHTNSKHNNPLCRVVPLEALLKVEKENDGKENDKTLKYYDKDKYREMILDAAETVLRLFGFDRTVYGNPVDKRKKKKWYEELHQERTKDIEAEML